MTKFSFSKNPKYREIMRSKIYSRVKILVGGTLMALGVVFFQTIPELSTVLALSSGGMFYWDINSQTKSSIEIEKRFEELQRKIEKLESKNKS